MVASSGGYQDIVELLLSHGANAYLKDNVSKAYLQSMLPLNICF